MKILLASDGSSNALNAAEFITGLAIANELEVHLIHVLADSDTTTAGSVSPWMPVWKTTSHQDQVQKASECHVDVLAMLAESCASVTMSHPQGDACNSILAEAESRDVDLIVMGARGHSMLDRVLLGSVSEYVAHHANRSVVVVRPSERDKGVQRPSKLLVAYDCSKGAYEAVQEILMTEWAQGTQVNVFSVAHQNLPFGSDTHSGHETSEVEKLRLAGEHLAGEVAVDLPNTSNQVVQASHAGEAIVQNAEETQSDLILLGEHGKGSIAHWILGNTTKYVLRHAPCSVWISRHHRGSDRPPTTAESVAERSAVGD